MLNHHLGGLLGLGSLGWAGHQIHVSLPVNKLLDAGIDPKEIPLPHELLLNKAIMADLYPSFAKGLAPFFTLNWAEYSDFLTFKGGLIFSPFKVEILKEKLFKMEKTKKQFR
jgi:photosystem I P700 chlorophyll a apoprotein A1